MAAYQIYELSARAVMSYAVEQDGVYTFTLNRSATEHCKVPGAKHEQDSCAMFHQMMYQLHGKGWRERGEEKVTSLSDVLFYMDFAGIFDRRGTGKTQQARREKSRDMFRPEGITLEFGSGPHRYVAFERSASMSRQSRLSFIRADLYEPMRQRIMLNIELDRCQLSKLYAYNGLMFSSGTRVDGIRIDKNHRVIVIDNPTKRVERAPVITLREDREPGTFYRADTLEDLDITCFDGVGLISKEYAEVVDKACCGGHTHTSFQIRMPYIKGMLHQVDFKDFLKRSGTQSIVDIWGKAHPVRSVDIILTRSQFKAYGWLRENGMTWEDYTGAVNYTARNKQDTTYLGRFTFDTILDFEGLNRVLTILARGFAFHNEDGSPAEAPRERIDYAKRGLCAWCSVPDSKKATPREAWQFGSDFRNLHSEFHGLVDENGSGWFHRHVHRVVAFVRENPGKVSSSAQKKCAAIEKGFDRAWRDKVIQMQIPLFAPTTKGQWGLRFDSFLAQTLELGPLWNEEPELPPTLVEQLRSLTPKGVPVEMVETLVAYYLLNEPEDSDWVVLPVANFDAYFGTTSFGRKYLKQIPETILERSETSFGLCRYRLDAELDDKQEEKLL